MSVRKRNTQAAKFSENGEKIWGDTTRRENFPGSVKDQAQNFFVKIAKERKNA